MEVIKNTNKTINQLIKLIENLSSQELTRPLDIINGASVGQHIRHIIEFYLEFINGHKSGTVCYDNRERNPDFESSPILIISKLKQIFEAIEHCDFEKNLKIKTNHDIDDTEETLSNSSVLREIVYALDHTVHHLAIIKIAMQVEFSQIEMNKNMGIAPSTIRNNNKLCAQ